MRACGPIGPARTSVRRSRTDLVLDALRMALTRRQAGADVDLVHHSDAGSQPGLNRSLQQCVQ